MNPTRPQIDAPLLDNLETFFFHQPVFDTPQLAQFIGRTCKARDEARVVFSSSDVWFILQVPLSINGLFRSAILCHELDLQVLSLVKICSSSSPQAFIPAVERLRFLEDELDVQQDDIETSQWLEFLRPFTAMGGLYLSRKLTPFIAPALQELVGESVTEDPPFRLFFWRGYSHRDLIGNTLISLLLRDSLAVILYPFLPGKGNRVSWTSCIGSMVDQFSFFLLSVITYQPLFFLIPVVWLLRTPATVQFCHLPATRFLYRCVYLGVDALAG
jgi:hypothetical protein